MLDKVKGLVIRSVDIKESDRLITIFTEELGVITALARGARSLKSRHMASTMQFCYSSFVLLRRGEHYQIKESELIESFFDIRRSIDGLALAAYILDVLCDVTTAQPERDLMRLSLNSLYAIASGKYDTDIVKAAFEIRCAAILGFMPEVLGCRYCDESHGDFYFDIMDGALCCTACHDKKEDKYAQTLSPHESRIIAVVSEGAKIALGYCIHCPIEKIFSFTLSGEDKTTFSRACELYLINQLERNFKTLEFYKEVR